LVPQTIDTKTKASLTILEHTLNHEQASLAPTLYKGAIEGRRSSSTYYIVPGGPAEAQHGNTMVPRWQRGRKWLETGHRLVTCGHWRVLDGITLAGFDFVLDVHSTSNYTCSTSLAQGDSAFATAYVLDFNFETTSLLGRKNTMLTSRFYSTGQCRCGRSSQWYACQYAQLLPQHHPSYRRPFSFYLQSLPHPTPRPQSRDRCASPQRRPKQNITHSQS
jgi:hypothetical protein